MGTTEYKQHQLQLLRVQHDKLWVECTDPNWSAIIVFFRFLLVYFSYCIDPFPMHRLVPRYDAVEKLDRDIIAEFGERSIEATTAAGMAGISELRVIIGHNAVEDLRYLLIQSTKNKAHLQTK